MRAFPLDPGLLERRCAINLLDLFVSVKVRDEATRQLKAIESEASRADKSVDRLGSTGKRLQSIGSGMQSIGSSMSKFVTLPLAAAGVASVKFAKDYEQSLRNAVSVTGLTGKAAKAAEADMDAFSKKMGQETAFSAKEAADAMYDLASAGWKTGDMTKGLRGIMDLAAATQTDLAQTTQTTVATLNQFGLEAEESSRVADVFAKVIGSTPATMDKLQNSMKMVGPVAASFGWTLEETTAALGQMYAAGFEGEQAGTALRGALASLATPVGQTKEALEAMGVSMEDVNPATNSLAEIMQTLKDAGMDTKLAMQLFGREAAPAMLGVAGQGVPALNDLTKALDGAGGTAGRVAKDQLDTFGGQLTILIGSLQTAAIEIGQRFTPALQKVVEFLTPLINSFAELPTPVMSVVIAVGALAAALGPLLVVAGLVVSTLGSLALMGGAAGIGGGLAVITGAIGSFVVAAAPFLAVAAAIAGAGYLIYKNWDTLGPIFGAVADAVGTILKNAFERFMEIATPVWEFAKSLGGNLLSGAAEKLSDIGSALAGLFPEVKIKSGGDALKKALTPPDDSVWDSLKTKLGNFFNWLESEANKEGTGVNKIWTKLSDDEGAIDRVKLRWRQFSAWFSSTEAAPKVQNIWKKLTDDTGGIQNARNKWSQFQTWLSTSVSGFMNRIGAGGIWKKLTDDQGAMDRVRMRWQQLRLFAAAMWSGITQTISGAWTRITTRVQTGTQAMLARVRTAWQTVRSVTASAWSAVVGVIVGAIQRAVSRVTQGWNRVATTTRATWAVIRNFITSVWAAIWQRIQQAAQRIWQTVSTNWNRLRNITSTAFNAIRDAIQTRMRRARELAQTAAENLRERAISAFEKLRDGVKGIFEKVRDFIANPVREAVEKVRGFISDLVGIVNRILKAVGLDEISVNLSGPTTGGNPQRTGGGRPRASALAFARGGTLSEKPHYVTSDTVVRYGERLRKHRGEREYMLTENMSIPGNRKRNRAMWLEYGDRTGFADEFFGRFDHLHPYPDAPGYSPHRRRNEIADALMGYEFARGGSLRGGAGGDGGRRDSGTMNLRDLPPDRSYGWADHVARASTAFMRVGASHSTSYPTHEGGGNGAYSTDVWVGGSGYGRKPSNPAQFRGFMDWVVGNAAGLGAAGVIGMNMSQYPPGSGWRQYRSGFTSITDMHDDHVHVYMPRPGTGVVGADIGKYGSPGTGGGFGSIPNPMQLLFEKMWRNLVKPVVDRVIKPLEDARYVLVKAAGAAARKVPKGIYDWIDEKIPDTIGTGGPDGGPVTPYDGEWATAKGGSPSQNRAIGKAAADEIWPNQWSSWDALAQRESGWDRFARNASSGAYGIPQSLPESKLPPAGRSSGGSHAGPQIAWMADYMRGRYGDPNAAKAHSDRMGWYEKGGLAIGPQIMALAERGQELILPLENAQVMRSAQTALGTAELRGEIAELRAALVGKLDDVNLAGGTRDDIKRGALNTARDLGYSREGTNITRQNQRNILTRRELSGAR